MIYRKKLWALLLSAALVLALLAGCGGGRALSRVFVDLLEGQYQNLSVETDPKLEAALKKAVKAGGTRAGRDDDDPDPDYTYNEATKTYTVYTAKGLKAWAEDAAKNLDLNCTLASDITLSGEWTPIGSSYTNAYTGTFNGNYKTITGLTVNTSSSYAGLFGCIGEGGKVQNLTLENVNISGNWRVGGVAGQNLNSITGCYHANGRVSGGSNVGGVVGWNNGGAITACYWDNNQSNGIGSGGGDVTQVTGTTTWGTAQNAMNTALAGCGWSYENGSGDQPLILKKIGG